MDKLTTKPDEPDAPKIHTYSRLVRPDCDRCGTNLRGNCPKCYGMK